VDEINLPFLYNSATKVCSPPEGADVCVDVGVFVDCNGSSRLDGKDELPIH
jgi:hypothetical protein